MSNRGKNRKRGKIDLLPDNLREAVDMMIQTPAKFTYNDIVDYIRTNGYEVSRSSVGRYAMSLNASLERVMLVSQNFRLINEEMAKYPDLDTTEAISRITSHKLFEAIQEIDEERLKESDPIKLIDKASAFVKAVSYKNDMDNKRKDIREVGFDSVKDMMFEAMAAEAPELYAAVRSFIDKKIAEDSEE